MSNNFPRTWPWHILLTILWTLAPHSFATEPTATEPTATESTVTSNEPTGRWSTEKAWQWYRTKAPLIGFNYLPSTAVNDTQMWQAKTFDPVTIDRELGWAATAGYNTCRVFLQAILWDADPEGSARRFEQFLSIADRHRLSVMPILFDDCAFAGKEPYLGQQDEPVPGVHNSQWVPSPGPTWATDVRQWGKLEKFVKRLINQHRNDRRVVVWDLYNEPGNNNQGEKSLPLVAATFGWARQANPSQPLTVGSWTDLQSTMTQSLMRWSDVVSFHGYTRPEEMESTITTCAKYGRPLLCTEWLFRPTDNTFEKILPLFARHQVSAYHWGLVVGRTQTNLHWGSTPGSPPPELWQHDLFHADGRPYDPNELIQLRQFPKLFAASNRAAEVTDSSYRGWKTHKLANGLIEVQVAPQLGGRVIQLALGDYEYLWVNQELAGHEPPPGGLGPDGTWLNYGGDKLWPAPQGWDGEDQWPGPPDAVLDGSPHEAEIVTSQEGTTAIRMTSGKDPRSGIQFTRKISVYPDTTQVHFESTMTNIDSRPRRWGIWQVTQHNAGGASGREPERHLHGYCPKNPDSLFPQGYRVMFGKPDNRSFSLDQQNNLVRVDFQYRVGKIGIDSMAGWLAVVHADTGHAFVTRFQAEPGRAYPDETSVQFWTNGAGQFHTGKTLHVQADDPVATPPFFESEVLSPMATLGPGASTRCQTDWYVLRIGPDLPILDCNELGVIARKPTARVDGKRLILTGNVGLFHIGKLGLACHDANGTELVDTGPILDVSPVDGVELASLGKGVEVPRSTRSAAVMLYNRTGQLLGQLAQAKLQVK